MNQPVQLYRKRYIPAETICLDQDKILVHRKNLIITSWSTLKPRNDISRGVSAYFIDQGFKVSKVFDKNDNLVYWYCDIIETDYNASTNTYVFQDLLVDVLVYEDGRVKVVDLNEVGDMLLAGTLPSDVAGKALKIADSLLTLIYTGEFVTLQNFINNILSIETDPNIDSLSF